MEFKPLETFWKDYAQLPDHVKKRARKAFQLFKEGAQDPPFSGSLRIEKMQGYPGIWKGHVTLDYVFTFHKDKDPQTGETVFVFRRIGRHDIYRNP